MDEAPGNDPVGTRTGSEAVPTLDPPAGVGQASKSGAADSGGRVPTRPVVARDGQAGPAGLAGESSEAGRHGLDRTGVVWYRSLYWRIALGFVTLLAVLLLTQALLYLVLTGMNAGALPARSPERLAAMVASDLSAALTRDPGLAIDTYVREQYGHLYQPVIVVMADGRIAQNRDGPPAPGLRRAGGRGWRPGHPPPDAPWPDGSQSRPLAESPGSPRRPDQLGTSAPPGSAQTDPAGRGGAGEPRLPPWLRAWPETRDEGSARGTTAAPGVPAPPADTPDSAERTSPADSLGRGALDWRGGPEGRASARAPIDVNGTTAGVVVVPTRPIPAILALRELGPTLGIVGAVLLVLGAAVGSLAIFRPAHRRIRSLELAAAAVGSGQASVRAPEDGGDEVTALARSFNRMAGELEARARTIERSDQVRRQLLADVSHELKTPLSAVRGYIETLQMPEVAIDEATRRRYLAIVGEEAEKLERIIGDLLDLTRLEGAGASLQPEAVPLERLFRRVSDRHERLVTERGIDLHTTTDGVDRVWADAGRIEQALQNLVANAVRHTPTGGRIALSAEPRDRGARLVVRDTGPGIDAAHLPHIFDRFYKADQSRADPDSQSGSGLGLSIVKAIVERHGGAVAARNHPDGGAEFTIDLPGPPAGL